MLRKELVLFLHPALITEPNTLFLDPTQINSQLKISSPAIEGSKRDDYKKNPLNLVKGKFPTKKNQGQSTQMP